MFFRLTLMALMATTVVDAQQLDEYQVKAAFLYNFANFVLWPTDTFRSPHDPFSICVLGRDPFGISLDQVAEGKVIAGHPVALRRISDAHETVGCQILFVSASEGRRALSVVTAAKKPGILTVGEAGTATSDSVVIIFTLQEGKVRFEINMAAAEQEQLRLSSKLLSLATVVRNKK